MRFSKTTGSFYPYDIDYGANLPTDTIDVEQAAYEAAKTARSQGKNIDFVDGELVIVDLPARTLEQSKSSKLAELTGEFSKRMAVIKTGYPDEEIQSWFQQSAEATAYTTDDSATTPLLSTMAGARGITVADLAGRIIANSAAYSNAAGAIIGKRQKYEDAVNAAADPAAVAAIVWAD